MAPQTLTQTPELSDFFLEFQPMASVSDNSSLSLDKDTNQFFGVDGD